MVKLLKLQKNPPLDNYSYFHTSLLKACFFGPGEEKGPFFVLGFMIAGFEPETLRSDRGNTFPAVMFHPWPIASTVFLTQELYWLSTVFRSRSRLGQPILVRLRSRPLSGGSATLVVHKDSAVVIIEGYVYCSIKSLLHPPPLQTR